MAHKGQRLHAWRQHVQGVMGGERWRQSRAAADKAGPGQMGGTSWYFKAGMAGDMANCLGAVMMRRGWPRMKWGHSLRGNTIPF